MTEFRKKELNAMEQFQQRIDKYGLKVSQSLTSGRYEGSKTDVFLLTMMTEPYPAKGNKKLIQQLENDGFYPSVYRRTDPKTGRKYMAFYIANTARIVV